MRLPLSPRLRLSAALGACCAALLTIGLAAPASAHVPMPRTATAPPPVPGPTLAQMNSARDHVMGSTLSLDPAGTQAKSFSAPTVPLAITAAPSGTPGVDVSAWQNFTAANWVSMYNSGIRFAYVKATESTYYTSSQFNEQFTDSAAAGMFHGAYHFANPHESSGAEQAQYFVAHGGAWTADGKTLPPLLDIEYDPYTSSDGTDSCYGLNPSQMVSWIQDFSDTVRRSTGRYPAIYSTSGWWTTCTGNTPSFSNSPLFIASWPADPSSGPGTLPQGWSSYTFWQWTDSTTQPSPTGSQAVDGDVLSPSLSLSAVATTASSGSLSFIDVPSSYPFATEIGWLASTGISGGWATPQGRLFQPQTAITRDAMAAFLYRFAGSPSFTPPATSPFTDVPTTYPFYSQITWLAATGITTGYPDGTFRPGSAVNRDAMAAFLYRFAGSPSFTPPATSPFTDVPTTYPFYDQITWLATTGITTGYPDGTFQPLSAVNRDAMAAFLYRYHNDKLPTTP